MAQRQVKTSSGALQSRRTCHCLFCLACDTSDPGFQILNDDEIVVSVREDVEVEVEEELSADVEVDAGPSASEAFAGLETALKWMERQPECDHLQLLTVKRMRDLAARKRLKTAYIDGDV
ncbi:unnamed protein product [Pieris macdunnoughi]|uniref:Uncharacterized protein n=1 Tax=Pieris macdunnoughi TaxID=345717 RepID=A0A821T9Z9_9NEOP|nr:unnamed protein product [Pieris macdunnoughi]